MDASSVGLATIGLGLILAIGAVRGTWRKVFADLGLSLPSSGGPSVPSGQPGPGGGIISPSGKVVCFYTASGTSNCVETEAQCAYFGGVPRPDTLGTCGPPVPEQFPTTPTQNAADFSPMAGTTQYIYRR